MVVAENFSTRLFCRSLQHGQKCTCPVVPQQKCVCVCVCMYMCIYIYIYINLLRLRYFILPLFAFSSYVIRCSSFSFMCYFCWWIRRLYAAPTRSSKRAWDPVTSQQGLCTETTEPTIGLMAIKAFSYLSANRRQTRWQLNCTVSYLQIQYRNRRGVTIKLFSRRVDKREGGL